MEPSKATEEALGGSRTAFWRPKGDGVCGTCGRRGAGEMRGVPLSSIWTKSCLGLTRYAPLQAGGGGF